MIFENDPFSSNSMEQFDRLKEVVNEEAAGLTSALSEGTRFSYVGPTASIRDLKTVTGQDQIIVNTLVIASVFLVLVVLLARVAISAYLIVSVFFSFLVTLV